ncbi:MAG: hypothetical protein GY714_22495 [Desulfobacterales bacterium]|nr:hypothetical protein [Desulfobacterales bacterium]
MINKFAEEILSKGATEVLPQNLSDEWLERLYYGAVYFIKVLNMTDDDEEIESEKFSDINSMILFAADSEIYQYKNSYDPKVDGGKRDESELYDNLSCLSLSYIFEMISRNSEIIIDAPTLENIYNLERVFEIEQKNPVLTDLLGKIFGTEND